MQLTSAKEEKRKTAFQREVSQNILPDFRQNANKLYI